MARLKREHRSKQILLAAYEIASDQGLYELTLIATAKRVKCSHGTIIHYYPSAIGLRDEVVEEAIRRNDLKLIGEAVFKKNHAASGVRGPRDNQALHDEVGTKVGGTVYKQGVL